MLAQQLDSKVRQQEAAFSATAKLMPQYKARLGMPFLEPKAMSAGVCRAAHARWAVGPSEHIWAAPLRLAYGQS